MAEFWDVQSDKDLTELPLDSFGDRGRAQGVSKSWSCFTRVCVVHGKVTVQGIFFPLSLLFAVSPGVVAKLNLVWSVFVFFFFYCNYKNLLVPELSNSSQSALPLPVLQFHSPQAGGTCCLLPRALDFWSFPWV